MGGARGGGIGRVDGRELNVDGPGCYLLVEHERHTRAELELETGEGVIVHATCFTPGLP